MYMQHAIYPAALLELVAEGEKAAHAIPPLFPLASSVAVNPFLGQSDELLAKTAARIARVAGGRIVPQRAHFAQKWAAGQIVHEDLQAALQAYPTGPARPDMATLLAALERPAPQPQALPTVAELAADVSGIDWPGIIAERVGHWAAAHFDQGQALWQPSRAGGAFVAWREFALRDLSVEIHGLSGFGAFVAASSRAPWRAIGRAAETLGLPTQAAGSAFHCWLMSLGGWAQYARYLLWQAELQGQRDGTVAELLAIRMLWDEALFERYKDQIAPKWRHVVDQHAQPVQASADDHIDAIWQEAAERAAQRHLAVALQGAAPKAPRADTRPALQAAFCIDVRSEVFRRALEAQDSSIETLGFAGFFGLTAAHRAAGSDVVEARGPVLLQMGLHSHAAEPQAADLQRRYAARARRAWGRFKLAAVSSFAFVEAMGPVYMGKLVRDALGLGGAAGAGAPVQPRPRLCASVDTAQRVAMAETVLRAMSLTKGFAPVVILAGHGATVANNPHESGLQCGACGGYAGDVNARLLAGVLNDSAVRQGLLARGLSIPADTVFVPALHDTTTDSVTLFTQDLPPEAPMRALPQLQAWLQAAGALARAERAARLPRAKGGADVMRRASDWAELRPEWGLAGCNAFVAAPRARTDGANLGGRAFLHSYDWRADDGFKVLELIMTAPVVVASWISLQYYGSAVAPQVFGGGNKLLHNVAGGIGVLEGNGGALRPGLPWQSVHDGQALQHETLRLSVVIEAPREAMSAVLQRHPQVRALFDNGWLHLIAMDENGHLRWRYDRALGWQDMVAPTAPSAVAAE